jgi:hypothetical protein
LRVEPDPTPEEVAAIAAALEALLAREPEDKHALNRSRWRIAGLLGPAGPQQMRLEGSLWSCSRWEGMT